MTRHDGQRIADIFDACDELDALTGMRSRGDMPQWVLDRAAERLLEIVGEAAGALSETTRAGYPDVPWRDITRLRILLAHHYQRIDPEQVWAIVDGEIPHLAHALQARIEPGQDV